MPLTQDLYRLKAFRGANPQLDQLSDTQLTDLVSQQTGELGDLQRSSALGRTVARGSNFLSETGEAAEGGMKKLFGESYPSRVAARATSMAVQSAPEYLINVLAAKKLPMSPLGATALGGLNFGLGYGRTAVETGDTKAALGSGAGNVMSLLGSLAGAKMGAGGYKPSGAANRPFRAGVGAFAGSLPGDLTAVATMPGGLSEFLDDPVNLPAMLASNLPYMAVDKAREVGEVAKLAREKKIAETPLLDEFVDLTPEQQYVKLSKIPLSQLTEQQATTMRNISRKLSQREQVKFERKTKNAEDPSYDTVPESQATILAQIRMLARGKKDAVMVPKGTKMPTVPFELQPTYAVHDTPQGYFMFNPNKFTLQAIDDAIKTDTLGTILGYGAPSKPKIQTGFTAVLRDAKGLEKQAVVLGDNNEAAVMAQLVKLQEPGDVIRKEKSEDVIEERLATRNKIKDYSISYEPEAFTTDAQPGVLSNLYERFWRERNENDSGSFVQAPHWLKVVGGKEVMVSPPANFVRYLKKLKITPQQVDVNALAPKLPPGQLGFDFDYSVQRREFFKNTVLESLKKSLTPTERKGARFQPDQAGMIGSKGVLKALEQWAPKEMFEHYVDAGLPTLLGTDKVSVDALSSWIQKNTPTIEVKNLVPKDASRFQHEADQLQHELETLGYKTRYDDTNETVVTYDDVPVDRDSYDALNIPISERDLIERYQVARAKESGLIDLPEDSSDAATGKYGVEPISVSEMDSPVDILVRVPTTAEKVTKYTGGDVLYRGPHFGDSDVNVVASIRGYFTRLASGEKAFFPFEIQSDWGQRKAKDAAVNEEGRRLGYNDRVTADHPLLRSYETLALKTAIKHALENGATKIVLPDSKTAMMTEKHDLYAIVDEYGKAREKLKQEDGMRQHYDNSIPAIASRLTGDSGHLVDLGNFTNREASSYFGGKKNITGRSYDITNLRPEVENLFSLYGLNDQHDLTQQLARQKTEIELALAEGRPVTPEEFVEASLRGENTDNATIVQYLKNLSGSEGPIKLFNLVGNDGLLIKGVSAAGETAVNAKLRGAQAIRTAAHEFSHGAMNKLQWGNPEAYADNVNFVQTLGVEGRKAVLKTIFDQVGIKDADLKYLSGELFKPDDPRLADKTAREFFAGLSEALAHNAFNDSQISPTVAKTLSWLPVGFQRWLSNLSQQWTRFFGPQYPSARHYLSGEDLKNLNAAYKRMMDFSYKNEAAQGEALNRLKRLELLDPATFVDRIETGRTDGWLPASRALNTGAQEFRDYALDFIKESRLATKINDVYEDNFLSALYRTKIYPETMDFFRELHHYRNKIKNYEHGYLSFLGQDEAGSLSQEQAIKNYHEYITGLISPFATNRNSRLEKMSKIIARNQEIREGLLNPIDPDTAAVGSVREDQLVSRDQMIKEFGLSDKDADFMGRLVKLPRLVAEQTLRQAQAVDTVNLSKLFYLQNKKQDIVQVKNKVAELTRTANEAGAVIVERKFYENYVRELKKNPEQNAILLSEMESKIFNLKQSEDQFRAIMEGQIRASFANEIAFDLTPGMDEFIKQTTNVANRLAEARAEQAFIMRDEGYAPMTRRGRFLVKVFKKSFDGKTMPDSTESLHGFRSKQEAQAFVKNKGLDASTYQIIDKETFAERAQLYSPYQLQAVRDKARADLDEMVRGYIEKLPESSERDSVANALIDIRNQFRPLDQEIKEVISAKGDKFKERRWLVPGFNEFDFIPNIFEYTNYKTIIGQKALTRAEAELQTLRPEVQTNPVMLTRMQRELEYVLSHTDEAAGLRKLIFYSYLGGSVRHVVQNLLQVPLNGIPEMVAQGAGMHAYSHVLKAGKLARDYTATGTTGNKTFDVLLKQAEKDGVTIPNAIEFFAPESADLQNALDSVSAFEKGQTALGEKTKYVASELGKGLEKFMRSTAVASEQVNRRVSFIMSLLESERTGINDPRQMFNKANVFTDYVNFVGDKSNRPGFQVKLGKSWAHSPVLVATALQSFVLNHIGQLYSYGRLAMRGNKSYQQAFATGTLHLVAMAGAMGIPFAQTAEQMFESATGISLKEAVRRGLIVKAKDWFDIQEKNGGRIADTVLNGFPKLAGIEASQSIGLGDPLFSYQSDRSPSALDMMGPLGGLVNKAKMATSAVMANPFEPEEWLNATRTVAPQALNYWFRLMDATMKGGYYDREGAPIVEGLNAKSSLSLAGGFTPTEVANVRQIQKMRRKIEAKDTEDYQNSVRLVAQNLFQFEKSGNNNDLVKANTIFSDYVRKMAGTQDRDSMIKSIAAKVQEFRTPSFAPPSLKTSRATQEALASYPETAYPTAAKLPVVVGELKAAQLLGQSDVLQRKLSAAKSAVLTSALYDHLVQAGYEPALAALLSQRGNTALRRQTEMLASQGSGQ